MTPRLFACLAGLGAVGVLALGACGPDAPPPVEELGREVHEQTLGEFNDGFRSACESRGLGRFTGGLSDDVCECALRFIRDQVADEELVPDEDGGIDVPEAIEERSLQTCLGRDSE